MQPRESIIVALLAWCGGLLLTTTAAPLPAQETPNEKPAAAPFEPLPDPQDIDVEWVGPARSLLPRQGMESWEAISFGGEGDCKIENGILTIESGDPLTGVVLSDTSLPKSNYEISLEARRMGGIDFFCGMAFPVQEDHCCLIVGGWAGSVVGLSNIDDEDASGNDTRRLASFKKEQWYRIRVRVMPKRIIVWIDDKCIIDKDITGRKISLRGDTLSLRPLGLCTFQTTSQTRKLTIRQFKPSVEPANRTPRDSHQTP